MSRRVELCTVKTSSSKIILKMKSKSLSVPSCVRSGRSARADLACRHWAEAKHSATLVRLGGVDAIIEQAIADGNIPGAVLVGGARRSGDLSQGLWKPGAGAEARADDAGYGV